MKRPILIAVAIAIAAIIAFTCVDLIGDEHGGKPFMQGTMPSAKHGQIPSFAGATGWLNSPPLTGAGLEGKVVLVDFWTLTCVNWLRTLPYVRAWAERYKDQGLVVIGVHTPEFAFEHNPDDVKRAVKDMRVSYPVALDPNYGVWNAFNNNIWPALYLFDAKGRLRYFHFGEGAYDEAERSIQALLAEAGHPQKDSSLSPVDPRGTEVSADLRTLESPESYVGTAQANGFASPGGAVSDQKHTYALPKRLRVNEWALAGDWTIGPEVGTANAAGGRVVFRFHGRDANLVMRAPGGPVRFKVRLDGKPVGAAHGTDVDDQGRGTLAEGRLYQLVRQTGAIDDREVEIEFESPGAEVLCFTFG